MLPGNLNMLVGVAGFLAMESSRSRNKSPVHSAPILKRSKSYQDVKELLLLHRRYETSALRSFRRGLTDLSISDKRGKRTRKITDGDRISTLHEETHRTSKCKQSDSLTKGKSLEDSEYLAQIISKIDGNGELSNFSSLAECVPKPNALRLPKLESIPKENKAIFYTTLPSIPALPKLKEPRTAPRIIKRVNKKYQKSDIGHYCQPDGCLTVRQLPRDHSMLRDFGAINAVEVANYSTEDSPTLCITSSVDVASTEQHKASTEQLLWLVPVVEQSGEQPFRLTKSAGSELDVRRRVSNKEKKGSEKRHEDKEESKTPKYKRNVHFSEYLHEIHLYTPLSTKRTSKT